MSIDGSEDVASSIGTYWPLHYTAGNFIKAPEHNGSLATLIATCGLIDSLCLLHLPPYPSTYAPGKNRIDFIYVSNDITSAALRSGVLPLYGVFQGDHNACFLDLDSKLLFGATHIILPPAICGLRLLDPRKVGTYINRLIEQADYHKVMEKIEANEDSLATNSWANENQILYEKMDKVISESMAEKLITRTITGPYDWSIEFAQSIQAVRYWRL